MEELQTTYTLNQEGTGDSTLPRWLVSGLQILAYCIPLSFLAYVLYINYLPFGYAETFTINVGPVGDTENSQPFYLKPSPNLSEGMVAVDLRTYRELNGTAYAVFNPPIDLTDAEITVTVDGEGVSIVPPVIKFDPDNLNWEYEWDFATGANPEELGLVGNSFPFDRAMYFDGTSRLELPNSSNIFEEEAFTVYAKWTPENIESNSQQIVGHYNWELWQNRDSVEFRVGRMNNEEGEVYSIKYPIDESFFFTPHQIVAVYAPSEINGHIDLFVDNIFAGRKNIGTSTIWTDYGTENLSFGWTSHGYNSKSYFKGTIEEVRITSGDVTPKNSSLTFNYFDSQPLQIWFSSPTTSYLRKIKLKATI